MIRAVVIGALAAFIGAGARAGPARQSPTVRIESGVVAGAAASPALHFQAIPYAAPPVGPLRWKPPEPAGRWTGVRAADAPGPACPQPMRPGGAPNEGGYAGPTSENCLTLDVWAPRGARGAPVMVWIFGGGDIAGATNLPSYDGRNFARDGVVLVAINYRLGALGFFAHPALTGEAPSGQPLANYGLMDQIAALKWVRRNIGAFGGDARNVTIFGESAGGADVLDLLAIPSAAGLFQRAIVQSGGGWSAPVSLAQREAQGAILAGKLGLPGAAATAEALRAVPAERIIAVQGEAGATVDGRLMKESATQAFARGHEAPVPLVIGSNSNEASLMGAFGLARREGSGPSTPPAYAPDAVSPEALARAMFNDEVMGAPARWIAERASAKAPAFLYYFSFVTSWQRGKRPGVNHASEIPFVFDSVDAVANWAANATPADRAEAAFVHSCWVGFARSGTPRCAGGPSWPAYTAAGDALLDFADTPTVRRHFRKAQLDFQEAGAKDRLAGR